MHNLAPHHNNLSDSKFEPARALPAWAWAFPARRLPLSCCCAPNALSKPTNGGRLERSHHKKMDPLDSGQWWAPRRTPHRRTPRARGGAPRGSGAPLRSYPSLATIATAASLKVSLVSESNRFLCHCPRSSRARPRGDCVIVPPLCQCRPFARQQPTETNTILFVLGELKLSRRKFAIGSRGQVP